MENSLGLPGKVSEWGHGPHAPNSYPPASASGNDDSPPLLGGQNRWLHQARPGWDPSKSGVQGPEGPLRSSPPCRSPGQARVPAWSSGWAVVSYGASRDWVVMVPKDSISQYPFNSIKVVKTYLSLGLTKEKKGRQRSLTGSANKADVWVTSMQLPQKQHLWLTWAFLRWSLHLESWPRVASQFSFRQLRPFNSCQGNTIGHVLTLMPTRGNTSKQLRLWKAATRELTITL